jgi:hypothetical protein
MAGASVVNFFGLHVCPLAGLMRSHSIGQGSKFEQDDDAERLANDGTSDERQQRDNAW